jgi:hypothetical protein
MATTILFADDQIPEDEIPDQEIIETISQRYPGVREGFIRAFKSMRSVVNALRDRGFDVRVANTYDKAMELASRQHFDIAIIDLGWSGDHSVKSPHTAGWLISNQIEQADKKLSPHRSTAQIIYSSRFATNPEISETACEHGILPLFKVYSTPDSFPTRAGKPSPAPKSLDAATRAAINQNSLAAAVGFIAHLLHARPELDAALKVLEDAKGSRKRWEVFAIACIAISVALVAVSVVAVIFLNRPAAIVTAISGAITSLIPALFFKQLKATRSGVDAAMKSVIDLSR